MNIKSTEIVSEVINVDLTEIVTLYKYILEDKMFEN